MYPDFLLLLHCKSSHRRLTRLRGQNFRNSLTFLPKLVEKQLNICVYTFAFLPELYYDRGNHHEFVSLVKDLARPGEITQSQTFDFEFTHVEKPYESYTGQNVKLR